MKSVNCKREFKYTQENAFTNQIGDRLFNSVEILSYMCCMYEDTWLSHTIQAYGLF